MRALLIAAMLMASGAAIACPAGDVQIVPAPTYPVGRDADPLTWQKACFFGSTSGPPGTPRCPPAANVVAAPCAYTESYLQYYGPGWVRDNNSVATLPNATPSIIQSCGPNAALGCSGSSGQWVPDGWRAPVIPRTYTLADLDRMRMAIYRVLPFGGGLELQILAETRLQIDILAGISPEALEEQAKEK
jgi:hypothetical protein